MSYFLQHIPYTLHQTPYTLSPTPNTRHPTPDTPHPKPEPYPPPPSYYYNMYIGGTPLLREGGVVVVVNRMHYEWSEPAHTAYKELFEQVIKPYPELEKFEKYQDSFVTNDRLNDSRGTSPNCTGISKLSRTAPTAASTTVGGQPANCTGI